MAWTKAKTISLIAAAVLVVIGIVLLFSRRDAERSVVRLADGTEVRVQQVTFGKKHRLVYGSWWEQMLERMPTNVSARFGVRPAAIDFMKEDTLMVWIEWRNGTNKQRRFGSQSGAARFQPTMSGGSRLVKMPRLNWKPMARPRESNGAR